MHKKTVSQPAFAEKLAGLGRLNLRAVGVSPGAGFKAYLGAWVKICLYAGFVNEKYRSLENEKRCGGSHPLGPRRLSRQKVHAAGRVLEVIRLSLRDFFDFK